MKILEQFYTTAVFETFLNLIFVVHFMIFFYLNSLCWHQLLWAKTIYLSTQFKSHTILSLNLLIYGDIIYIFQLLCTWWNHKTQLIVWFNKSMHGAWPGGRVQQHHVIKSFCSCALQYLSSLSISEKKHQKTYLKSFFSYYTI